MAWLGYRARRGLDRDRAFAAAVVGMLLSSPVAWPHYFLLLLLPGGLLWTRLEPGLPRWIFLGLLPVFWLPDTTFAVRAMGRERAADIVKFRADPPRMLAVLTGLAVFSYALLALFALVAYGRLSEPTTTDNCGSRLQND